MLKALGIFVLMLAMGAFMTGCGSDNGSSGSASPEVASSAGGAASNPTATAEPTAAPTVAPTAPPTAEPTAEPTVAPTAEPTSAPLAAASLSEEYLERGEYAAGVRRVWFHDPERPFDGWNAKHASDGYKRTLAEINAAGERQIVAALMWYPVRDDGSARKAAFEDLSAGEPFEAAYGFAVQQWLSNLQGGSGASRSAIIEAAKERMSNSLLDAPPAEGAFPVIIAAHGLGGTALQWATFAEYLASRGYVVVAPGFISDSASPNVFGSPDSQFAQSADAGAVESAYRTIVGEFKVIPGFNKYFFGIEGGGGFGGMGGGGSLTAVPGGGDKVGEMMAEFFTQRVGDVETIIAGLDSLNKSAADCAADYESRGQPNHGAAMCGAFAGALDMDGGVGVMGHSLGSMTAQFAVAKSDRVAAAVGYNNGPPRYWEPPGIFGDGLAADGQPAGNPKPVLQIHGSEDSFVQNVFRGMMWNALSAAGGDPEDIWVLEAERETPSDENPQPIARNAYARATGDKAIILVKDLDHDTLTGDFPTLASRQNPLMVDGEAYWTDGGGLTLQRKAVGDDVFSPSFQGEPFQPVGWRTVGGEELYMPSFIRNYYTRNWFDRYLKGDPDAARRAAQDPAPETGLLDVRSSLGGR